MASITKKATTGYLVRWREYGKQRSKYFALEPDAIEFKRQQDGREAARRAFAADTGFVPIFGPGATSARPGDAADPANSLAGYLRGIITANRDLRETTRNLYLRNLRVHLEETPLGRADLREVTPEALVAYWGGLTCGPGALNNIHQLLSIAFRRAVRTGLIDRNPMDRAEEVRKPSRRHRREVRPLTVEEVERLADSAANTRDRLETLVMAYGGLRAGEIGGLRQQDVNWERNQLRLRQQVVRIPGKRLEIGDLKTAAARRTVTLPRSLMKELREFVDQNPGELVFTGTGGGLRDHIRINTSLQRAAKRAGVKTHSHALRHTAVSLWIEDGASPVDVSRMIGHSDVSTTLGLYTHLFTYGGEALAESMERRREEHRDRA